MSSTVAVPPLVPQQSGELMTQLWSSGKPVMVFGFTKGGDPLHPQMLGYDRRLVTFERMPMSVEN